MLVVVTGEEVVVEGSDAGKLNKGSPPAVTEWIVVVVGVVGNVKAGEEGFESGVAIDEGGEEVGPVLDVGAESEDDEGEEDECEEMGCEDGGGLPEELGCCAVVNWR